VPEPGAQVPGAQVPGVQRPGAPGRREPGAGGVRVPVLMLGAATLLWGWQQEAAVYAAIAALALECARIAPFRWAFDDEDFHRLGDASGVGLIVLAVVQFGDRGLDGIYGVLRWFPLVVLGLTLAQLYSTRRTVYLSAMFLSVRFALRRGRITYPGELDMRLPYLVACLLSACAGPDRSEWAVAGAALLLGWLLWANRPRRRRLSPVLAALGLCALVALAIASSVTSVRRAVGPVIMDIVRERVAHWRDPFRNHTALGEIGRLKSSDRIVLRVESPPGTPVPALLHEASYTHLSNNVWLAGAARFEPLAPQADGTRWDLAEDRRPFRTVTVAKSLIRNKGMLAVPPGSFRIDELPVEELHASPQGALKVVNGPAMVRYRVRFTEGAGRVSPPGASELVVPGRLEPVLARTLERLDLAGAPPQQVVRTLLHHFDTAFRYSLTLREPQPLAHPVEDFLERTRAGHCEFFATATVLLLRAAGIPARYATGYAVQEYSPLEEAWVVRRRHAHSWASAWIDGRWVAVDTTPSQWVAEEAAGAAWWQPVYDAVSWVLHRISRWRLERAGAQHDEQWLLWLLAPLVAFLAWRIYHSRRVGRGAGTRDPAQAVVPAPALQGTDSAFYRLEAMLDARGLARPAPCTPRRWLAGLARDGALPPGGEHWREIVSLHYRARFDPRGLDEGGRARLAAAVAQWLRRAGAGGAAG